MEAELIGTALGAIVKAIIDKFVRSSEDYFKKQKISTPVSGVKTSEILELQLGMLITWSERVHLFGLTEKHSTAEFTVELKINSTPKKLGKKLGKEITEGAILTEDSNFLILGQPGSGKSTTLKRLIRTLLAGQKKYDYRLPILIRLRKLDETDSVAKVICRELGLPFKSEIERVIKETEEEISEAQEAQVKEEKSPNVRVIRHGSRIVKVTKTFEEVEKVTLFDKDVMIALPHFLSWHNAILFIDGLDEVVYTIRRKVLRDITSIGLRLLNAKIILTSRSSEYDGNIEGFTVCEIQPLKEDQIKTITTKWLINPDVFLDNFKEKPYRDILNRPLFMTFLIISFEKNGELPEQAVNVYREVTTLILNKWSEDVNRRSKYANFSSAQKLTFLSELAYEITYIIQRPVFNSRLLEDFYKKICDKYGLPKDEFKQVANEIESHNGIVSESYLNQYEFSHLSLQEYLCAEYIVRQSLSKTTFEYLEKYPEPLAIATVLSTDASVWLANLLLSNKESNLAERVGIKNLQKFLNRLLDEAPIFKVCQELGFVYIYLTNIEAPEEFSRQLDKFLHYRNVLESCRMAMKNYEVIYRTKSYREIRRRHLESTEYFIIPPYTGRVPLEVGGE